MELPAGKLVEVVFTAFVSIVGVLLAAMSTLLVSMETAFVLTSLVGGVFVSTVLAGLLLLLHPANIIGMASKRIIFFILLLGFERDIVHNVFDALDTSGYVFGL